MSHVLHLDTIPPDIRGAFEILAAAGALSIGATDKGRWCLRIRPGANPITMESALRAAGMPAFAGSPTQLSLRAIRTDEIALFDEADQQILRAVVDDAARDDSKSVMQLLVDGLL